MSDKSLDIFQSFIISNHHILTQDIDDWSKERILYQLAYEHADNSIITKQAEKFLVNNRVNWYRLKLLNREKNIKYKPQAFSLHFNASITKFLLIKEHIITFCVNNILRVTTFKQRNGHLEIERTRIFKDIHHKSPNKKSISMSLNIMKINDTSFLSFCYQKFIFWELNSLKTLELSNIFHHTDFNFVYDKDNIQTDYAWSEGDSNCFLWRLSNKTYNHLQEEKYLGDDYPFFITTSSKKIIIRNLKNDTIEEISFDHDNYDVKILSNYLVITGLDKSIIVRNFRSKSILFDNHLTNVNLSTNLERSLWINEFQLLKDDCLLYSTGFWHLLTPCGRSKQKNITNTFIIDFNNNIFFQLTSSNILLKVYDYLFYKDGDYLIFYSTTDNLHFKVQTISAAIFSSSLNTRVISKDMFLSYDNNTISIFNIKPPEVVLHKSFEFKSNIYRIVKEFESDFVNNCFVVLTENGDVNILNEDLSIDKYVGHTSKVVEYKFLNNNLFTKSTDGSFRYFNLTTKESLSFPGHIENSHLVWINKHEFLSFNNYIIRYTNLITSETSVLSGSTGLARGVFSLRDSIMFKHLAISWDTTGFLRFWDLRKIKTNKVVKGHTLRFADNHESAITYVEKINSNEFLSFSRDGSIVRLNLTDKKFTQIFPLSPSNKARPQITGYEVVDKVIFFISNKSNDLISINLENQDFNRWTLKESAGRIGIRNIKVFGSKIVYNTFNRSISNLAIFDFKTNSHTDLECNGILYQSFKKISKSKFVSFTNFSDAKNEIGYLTLWDVNSTAPVVNICNDEFRTTKEQRKELDLLANRKKASLTGVYPITSNKIATYHKNGYIVFWFLKQKAFETKKIHNGNIVGVYFINKKDFYSWSTDGTLKFTKDNSTQIIEKFNPSLERGVGNTIQAKFKRSKIIIFSANGIIRILNRFNHSREFYTKAHSDYIYDVLIYYNKVISASRDNTVKIWNFRTKKLLTCHYVPGIRKIYLNKNELIVYSNDGNIKIFSMDK